MDKLFRINPLDNVAVALEDLKRGYSENGVTLLDDVPFGHKVLLEDLKADSLVIKYGNPIGRVAKNEKAGAYIHQHNLKTNLTETKEYTFSGDKSYSPWENPLTFNGYERKNGSVGIRNEIWIIPTVGCVNSTVRTIENKAQHLVKDTVDGIFAFTHPYGCSQMGDDQENTRRILSSLINHPNAGGVLVVSLGCENSNADVIKNYLGDYDTDRVKFLVTQECNDEIEEGVKLIKELCEYASKSRRTPVSIDKLVVGLKCGGSDAFSGITANPLIGRFTDKLTSIGGSCILTETPEMFGAEHILMNRCVNEKIFSKTVKMINDYKSYFAQHNEECYENPSPGNHNGGITTLEEKSLGCIQKGGDSVVTDVLSYGERCKEKGLSLLSGPGNDIVSTTNLAAAGAQIILFSTGRGTPLGSPVPTVKISSNNRIFEKKPQWIDFNAGTLIENPDFDKLSDRLFQQVLDIASGAKTKNEINNCREISIFKDGVVM